MNTSHDIEVAFLQANMRLNNMINRAQMDFYRHDLDLGRDLSAMMRRPAGKRPVTNNNPLTGGTNAVL